MNKQEQLKELRQTMVGVSKLINTTTQEVFEKHLLPIAQSCCDKGFTLRINYCSENSVDLTFDLDTRFDFHIRLNSQKMIELSHGLYGSCFDLEQRKYLIQLDKIIARLWDKEKELKECFELVAQERKNLCDLSNELQRKIYHLESEIEQEEREDCLKQLVVGSKWVYSWDKEKKRPLTITKITPKTIFFERPYQSWGNNSNRAKIKDMINDLKYNRLIKYEEESKQ